MLTITSFSQQSTKDKIINALKTVLGRKVSGVALDNRKGKTFLLIEATKDNKLGFKAICAKTGKEITRLIAKVLKSEGIKLESFTKKPRRKVDLVARVCFFIVCAVVSLCLTALSLAFVGVAIVEALGNIGLFAYSLSVFVVLLSASFADVLSKAERGLN